MNTLQSVLHSTAPYVHKLIALAHSPSRVIIIEGGNTLQRRHTAFAYALLCSCLHTEPPCYTCEGCSSLIPHSTIKQEYTLLEKKQKQEHGSYIILGDICYLNGTEGVYIKQIVNLKKHLGDSPRFHRHLVIIEDCHAIHSIKEIANALLKVMEETLHSTFIVTVPERNSLIQTILSRAFIITLPFQTSHDIIIDNEWVDALITFLSHGSGWFARSLRKIDCVYDDIIGLLSACTIALCEYINGIPHSSLARIFAQYKPSIPECTAILHEAEFALQANINPMLIADTLAIRLYSTLHSSA